jgi:hypothetical protein
LATQHSESNTSTVKLTAALASQLGAVCRQSAIVGLVLLHTVNFGKSSNVE